MMRLVIAGASIMMIVMFATDDLVFGQSIPVPSSAADLFVAAFPGLGATDLCVAGTSITCASGGFPAGVFYAPYSVLMTDAAGLIYFDGRVPSFQARMIGVCLSEGSNLDLLEWSLLRVSAAGEVESIGAFRDQCIPGDPSYRRRARPLRAFGIDPVNGYLYVQVDLQNDRGCCAGGGPSGSAYVRVTGLPNVLDIALTYEPPSTLSFNVPVRSEGLAGADSFSLYAGDVRDASDLSRAFALQCTVPSGRPPAPGEQLSVPDTLPDPAPGESRYYLAAVNYQGQRRAGRSAINGVLQGRNAAALPGCP